MARIRITRPLRDLLRASPRGVVGAARELWGAASRSLGDWSRPDLGLVLGPDAHPTLSDFQVRASADRLEARGMFEAAGFLTMGGRVDVYVRAALPDAAILASRGRPLADLVRLPFLDDPGITVVRILARRGAPSIDVRCRCPSHGVDLP